MEELSLTASESTVEVQPGSTKNNFKTFSLLRQQDDRITHFENNLQKTLDLLNIYQTERSNIMKTQQQEEREETPQQLNMDAFQHTDIDTPRHTNIETIADIEPAHEIHTDLQDINNASKSESLASTERENRERQAELRIEDLSRLSATSNTFKISSLESEIRSLKVQMNDLERENQILKNSLNSLSLMRNTVTGFESRPSVSFTEQKEIHELRVRLTDAQSENESLRQDLLKVKTESFSRFETLQRNNDELLESYEQRVIFICLWLVRIIVLMKTKSSS